MNDYRDLRLLVLDVDGVLTDGGIYVSESGEESKRFHVHDGQGIKLLQKAGIEVAIISGSASEATRHRAQKLGIGRVHLGTHAKLAVLDTMAQDLGIAFDVIGYVGDDLVDLPCMARVGFPFSVANAMPQVKAQAHYVSALSGGQGAVREICELILNTLDKAPDQGATQNFSSI